MAMDSVAACSTCMAEKGHCVVYSLDGPITLPCDAVFVMSLLRRRVSEEVERAVLSSILIPRRNVISIPLLAFNNQQLAVCSF